MSMPLAAPAAFTWRLAPVPGPELAQLAAANDDDPDRSAAALQQVALRLFAEHGADYSRFVAAQAEQAFFADQGAAYRWWLSVGRALDTMFAVGQRPAC